MPNLGTPTNVARTKGKAPVIGNKVLFNRDLRTDLGLKFLILRLRQDLPFPGIEICLDEIFLDAFQGATTINIMTLRIRTICIAEGSIVTLSISIK
jgi:hypothetical protein